MRKSSSETEKTKLIGDCSKFRYTDEYPDNLILALGILPSSNEEIHNQQIAGLKTVLDSLQDREREILIERFRDQKTQRECADIHQISYQRIAAIEKGVLDKLKHPTRMTLIIFGPEQARCYDTLKAEVDMLERRKEILQKQIEQMEKVLHRDQKQDRNNELDTRKEWASISINDIGLSARARYRLIHNQIYTLYDLSRYSLQDLLAIHQMGKATVDEIVKKAAKFGLHIKEK